MVKLVLDQAEGLRRLVARHTTRIVAVVGSAPEAGQTSVALNLASALAHHGQDVVLADESGHAAPALGLPLRGDIHDVIAGRVSSDAIRVHTRDNVVLVPVAHRHPERIDPQHSLPMLTAGEPDVVVVDCTHTGGVLSPLAAHAHDVLVVLGCEPAAITGAYSWIKQAHFEYALAQFRVLVNRAEDMEARVVCRNLATTASRYLAVSLELAGHVPSDRQVMRARHLTRTVVDAFPMAPAAVAYRQLASQVTHWPLAMRETGPTGIGDIGGDRGGEMTHGVGAASAHTA
ncbi:Flagellum site-determining protein YlxH [Pandoraea capi]|uniref:Flagellum site-determining protein YlxH n=1 Tax=Pandoraea capi TaxID=2508286 RepID=A0ABY6WAQ8_9BURK|nr:MinD/ParA family protein [Pandoraea capi]VVE41976.1 Flagellum site-determining protein YlxH [Pandoraea capi]